MGRVSEAINAGPPRVGHWCDICAWLATLDEDDSAAFTKRMDDGEEHWGDNLSVAEWLTKEFGVDVQSRDVYNHRRARA